MNLDYEKSGGLIPAIIQDITSVNARFYERGSPKINRRNGEGSLF